MSSQNDTLLETYDMYVMDNSGVPIFAGCTISDYCMAHTEQHPLHTGFISALQSFGKEVFSGDLQKLNFPEIKINFKFHGDYIFVLVNPNSADDDLINEKAEQIVQVFKDKYEKKINIFIRETEQFDNFVDDMVKIGILPKNRLQSTKHYFVTDDGESEEMSASLINRFKQRFRSLVKK